ncbi:beta carbonic anhydrase 3 isoform X4 [Vitis vinifera]|nr:beta carbonic anhydrase 3 isoform X4 [Vitis vinifera]|eukprot:XP_010664389.1 PREDICTED: beta carbonic anhydrase 3 isoform X3 [Vitis vinifera]
MAALRPSSVSFDSSVSGPTNSFMGLLHKSPIFDSRKKLVRVGETHLGSLPSVKRNLVSRLEASSDSLGCGQHLMSNKMGNEMESLDKTDQGLDFFEELKHRFLCFKKQKYLEEPEHFQALAKAQSPKFMVIACADSRVCPSNILGFQPGEAFMIRNVANLVPPVENGPSETNAALEFAVNTLEVENILVIGHSSCAGIETLVRMRDDVNSSSFVENWVANGKVAKLRTKAAAGHLGFYQQCKYCEKMFVVCKRLLVDQNIHKQGCHFHRHHMGISILKCIQLIHSGYHRGSWTLLASSLPYLQMILQGFKKEGRLMKFICQINYLHVNYSIAISFNNDGKMVSAMSQGRAGHCSIQLQLRISEHKPS